MSLKLYPYQELGVKFMRENKKVILADEMGLGKTAQAIMASEPPVLVIASKGMKYWWKQEIERWYDEGSTWIPECDEDVELSVTSSFTIVHWEVLRLWPNLRKVKWGTVIPDEAHKAKNRKAQRTKALWAICRNAERVLLLTGTPIVNQPADIWSLLKCLYPKEYTSYWRFFNEYVLASQNPWGGFDIIGVKNREGLLEEISDKVLRRTKKSVLPDLPPKVYTVIPIELYPDQVKAYNEMRDYMLTIIEDNTPVMAPTVLAQITRLRQITVGHGAFTEPSEWPRASAAKLDVLVDYLDDRDGKTFVVTQFVWAATEAARRLNSRKISAEVLTGATPVEERVELIERFQEQDDPKVLCATIQTGGEGWTLTTADMIVFLDRPWSPQVVSQAEDRLHRIGQRLPVQIVSLIAENTIEDRVEEALAHKQDIFNGVFGRLKELL